MALSPLKRFTAGWNARRALSPWGLFRGWLRSAVLCGIAVELIVQLARIRARPLEERLAMIQRRSFFVCRVFGVGVEVVGEVPKGAFVLASNHRCYFDIAVLHALVPGVFLAKQEVAGWPLFGLAARGAGTVFVQREKPQGASGALADLESVTGHGQPVIVFPEGHTMVAPDVAPLKKGAFRLALAAGVPVVPVALEYSVRDIGWDTSEPDWSLLTHMWTRFGRRSVGVRVQFGTPLDVSEPGDVERVRSATYDFITAHLAPPTVPALAATTGG